VQISPIDILETFDNHLPNASTKAYKNVIKFFIIKLSPTSLQLENNEISYRGYALKNYKS